MSTNNNNNSKSCFNCGKVGHMRRDCTNPRSNGNQITPSNRRNQSTNANNGKQSASSSSSSGNNKSSNKQPLKVELPTNQNIVPLIDIGVNLTNRRFKQDLPAVLERSKQVGLSHLIITGTSEKASKEGIAFCMKYNKQKDLGIKLVSTVGCHPHDAKSWKFDNDQTLNSFRKLLKSPDVVAVGECGLDFNRMFSPQDVQEKVFEEQIKLAIEVKKPLFLHERDAHDSFIKILNKHKEALKKSDVAVVVHCFTGSLEHVKDYLQFGCYIGLTGFICDSRPGRGDHLGPVAKAIPADKLLIETDAPFITPRNMPRRLSAGGRCEPFHIVYVLNQLAKLRGIAVPSKEFDQLAKQMHENSLKVFQIQTDAQ